MISRTKLHILFFGVFLAFSCATSQNLTIQKFAGSFKEISSNDVVDLNEASNRGIKMTESEALKFVYGGIKARLVCRQKAVNMETEKGRIVEEIYLPEKCFSLRRNDLLILAHTFYQCDDINTPPRRNLILKTLDRNLKVVDSLIVNRADDFDFQISGLYNPENSKVFLFGLLSGETQDAALYKINPKNLKFEKTHNKQGPINNPGDLLKLIKGLGWEADFLSNKD